MAFFKLAIETGFAVEKIWEEVMEKVMFEKDTGVSEQGFFSKKNNTRTIVLILSGVAG